MGDHFSLISQFSIVLLDTSAISASFFLLFQIFFLSDSSLFALSNLLTSKMLSLPISSPSAYMPHKLRIFCFDLRCFLRYIGIVNN